MAWYDPTSFSKLFLTGGMTDGNHRGYQNEAEHSRFQAQTHHQKCDAKDITGGEQQPLVYQHPALGGGRGKW
jgi:hypothetical protein